MLAFFRKNNLIWTNIDQPQISQSLPLTALVTAGTRRTCGCTAAITRTGFPGQGRDARYDYSYSAAELGRLGEVVARLQEQAKKVFVSGNNHYKGAAVKNLLQLKEILLKRRLNGRMRPSHWGSGGTINRSRGMKRFFFWLFAVRWRFSPWCFLGPEPF